MMEHHKRGRREGEKEEDWREGGREGRDEGKKASGAPGFFILHPREPFHLVFVDVLAAQCG